MSSEIVETACLRFKHYSATGIPFFDGGWLNEERSISVGLVNNAALPLPMGRFDIPDLKIFFMSGSTANVIVHRGELDEGIHFIQKPLFQTGPEGKVRDVLDAVDSAPNQAYRRHLGPGSTALGLHADC